LRRWRSILRISPRYCCIAQTGPENYTPTPGSTMMDMIPALPPMHFFQHPGFVEWPGTRCGIPRSSNLAAPLSWSPSESNASLLFKSLACGQCQRWLLLSASAAKGKASRPFPGASIVVAVAALGEGYCRSSLLRPLLPGRYSAAWCRRSLWKDIPMPRTCNPAFRVLSPRHWAQTVLHIASPWNPEATC